MEYEHLMVDIETMGTNSYAAILSIAAVEFNIVTGEIGQSFTRTIDLQSCLDLGLKIQASTLKWWMTQSSEAKLGLFKDPISLPQALLDFAIFCKLKKYQVWGNSNRFDLGLLSNAYEKCAIDIPWDFRKERDVRTLVSFEPSIKNNHEWIGTAHSAFDDCLNQIAYCSKIWNSLTHIN